MDGQADDMAFDVKDEDYFEHENEDDCFNWLAIYLVRMIE
jgi:hypothetical protein